MTEAAILETIETLNQAVARLQKCVEDLEDLRDLEAAIAENAGKPLIPWGASQSRTRARIGESNSLFFLQNRFSVIRETVSCRRGNPYGLWVDRCRSWHNSASA